MNDDARSRIGGDAEITRTSDGSAQTVPGPRRTWGELQILAEIGAGGYGRVYRARDPNLARDVALKIIAARDAAHAAALLSEGQMLARVRHRNVVTVHAAQRIGTEVGLTMELIAGQHLGDVVRQRGPMGAEEAAVVGVSLCQALAAVHAAGLLHRDVKTRNVMRESGGRIVLMDFGAGREAGELRHGHGGDLSGTPLYMAPELFAGRPASVASDLYSLGVLMFYLVTGDYPVREKTLAALAIAHRSGHRRLLSDLRPDLPIEFVRVIEGALSSDPDRRFRTAGAMMSALAAATPGATVHETGRPAGPGADERDVATGPASRPDAGRKLVHWAAATVAGVLAVPLFGAATSATFNLTLSRRGEFSDDTIGDWWVYGFQSLVPVSIYATLTIIVVFALRAAWGFVRPARQSDATDAEPTRPRPSDPVRSAQGLVVLQCLALASIVWLFADVLSAVAVFADVADLETLRILSRSNYTPVLYRQVLTVVVVLTVVAWLALLRRPGARRAIDTPTKAAGAAIVVVMVLMLQLPYRLMFQNKLPIVRHQDQHCFELGSRETGSGRDMLIYCPGWSSPRIRVVPARGVVDMKRQGDLFSDPGPADEDSRRSAFLTALPPSSR